MFFIGFHLCNHQANYQLNITMNGSQLKHNFNPKILGIILDRSWSFRSHLENKAKKLISRNNLLQQLGGTSWGGKGDSLRTAALSLVFSAAEYCSSIWLNSSHSYKIDVQLNRAMRIISGTIKSTPIPWLAVLCNIDSPHLRRKSALVKTVKKCLLVGNSVLNNLMSNTPPRTLVRRPPYDSAIELISANFNVKVKWKEEWLAANVINSDIVVDPLQRLPGFDLVRSEWCTLNRIRTSNGKCAKTLHRWGALDSEFCDCGPVVQSIQHIVSECPSRRFNGSLIQISNCEEEAMTWLRLLDVHL